MPFDIKSGPSIPRPQNSPSPGGDYTSVPRPSPSQTPPSGGFSNKPRFAGGSDGRQLNVPQPGAQQPPQRRTDDSNARRQSPRVRPSIQRNSSVDIPWNIILIVAAIIAVIVLLITFRDEINSFFMQLLEWVFYLVIIIAVFKFIIFPRRR